jgi:FkbM family methyltransferase
MYRGRHAHWEALYEHAELRYAPRVSMELLPGDVISDCIAFTGLWELALTSRLAQLAAAGGTLVDVGANLGYFALLWAAAKPENKCIAFEASPRNVDILRRNVRRNGFESQIEVIPVAAGKHRGKVRFDPGPLDQTGWGGVAAANVVDGIEVDMMRVDEVVQRDSPIALLKVDIEGADAWALMGCERLLKARAVREVWFEQNKPRIRSLGIPLDAAQEYLRFVGYVPRPQGNASDELVEWSAVPA